MTYTAGLWPFITASIIMGGLIVYGWRFRKMETGVYFFFLMICALLWVGFFVFEIACNTLQAKLFFVNIEFLGIGLLPVAWVFMVLSYTGQSMTWKKILLWLVLPTIDIIIIWSNSLHHWFMGNPQIMYNLAPFPVLNLDYQFWFYSIHAPLGYIYIAVAIILLVRAMIKMDRIYQWQSGFMLLALILPTTVDVLYYFGISPFPYFNYSTAVFSISGLILIWILFRFRFLDLLPIARDTVIDNLEDSIIIFDHKKRLVHINPAARKLFDISPDMLGQTIDKTQNEYLQKISTLLQENKSEIDIEIGEEQSKHFDSQATPVLSRRGLHIGWVVTSHDVTERTRIFQQVQDLSVRDNLTGIYNRRHFFELSQRELLRIQRSQNSSASVVMIDLDHFKQVNDNYGHAAGDQVLILLTQTILEQLRKYDIFGRIGGDEFTLLLNDVSAGEALNITNRLRTSIAALRIPFEAPVISINACFGIVASQILEKNDLTIERMLKLADKALYEAKKQGRNCTVDFKK